MSCLFLFFEKANVPSVLPVIHCLRHRGRLSPALVRGFDYKEHAGQIAKLEPPEGVELLEIEDYERDSSPPPWDGDLRELLGERAVWADDPLDAVLGELLRGVAEREYMALLLARVNAITTALERLVAERSPRLVVLPEDTDYARGRLAALVLSRLRVPVVVVLPTFYCTIVQYPLLGPRLAGDYVVMNGETERALVAQGVPGERVHLLGSPFLEGAGRVERRPSPRPTFLFVLQRKEWEHALLSDLLAIFRDKPEWTLSVKAHPECPPDYVRHDFRSLRNVQLVAGSQRIWELLAECTAVVGQTSIALYEALAARVPAIFICYGSFPPEMRVPEGAELVCDAGALRAKLEACAAGRSRVPQLSVPSVGAAERIAAFLEDAAGPSREDVR